MVKYITTLGCSTYILAAFIGFLAFRLSEDEDLATLLCLAGIGATIAVAAYLNYKKIERNKQKQKEWREREWERLTKAYGLEGATNIQAKSLWVGCPEEALHEMFGFPDDKEERVRSSKVTKTLKYFRRGHNRYGLRVTVDNGIVSGWDDKR